MDLTPRPSRNHVERLESAVRALTVGIEHSRSEIVAALETTTRGVPQRGARPVAVVDGNGNGAVLTTSPGRLAGINLRETTGAGAVVVRIHDSRDVSGDSILDVVVPAGGSVTQWLMPEGINYAYALFVEIVSAAGGAQLTGSAYLAGQ